MPARLPSAYYLAEAQTVKVCAFCFCRAHSPRASPSVGVLANSTEPIAFTLLLWQELFDENSPYSMRPRLQNIPALVEELHFVAELAATSDAWRVHLKEIRAELDSSVAENRTLLVILKYAWTLKDLIAFDEPSQVATKRHAWLSRMSQDSKISTQPLYTRLLASCQPTNKTPVAPWAIWRVMQSEQTAIG